MDITDTGVPTSPAIIGRRYGIFKIKKIGISNTITPSLEVNLKKRINIIKRTAAATTAISILSMDRSWTVGERQMAVTDNAFFMHCLPVRRNMIVTDDVIEGPRSLVIPEAANREISATVVLKKILESL